MSINILSANKSALINYDNVASISIQKEYVQYKDSSPKWNLVAYFPAVSSDVLTAILGTYKTEDRCEAELKTLIDKIKAGDNLICVREE